MRYQDQLVKQTQKALMDLVRAAEHVPTEKVDWSPVDGTRSTLNQMQEIAMAAATFASIIEHRSMPPDEAHAADSPSRTSGCESLSACIDAARAGTQRVCSLITNFPDAELDNEVHLTFGPGMTITMADLLALHHWNMVYHLGQINYIQTCLGDRKMH